MKNKFFLPFLIVLALLTTETTLAFHGGSFAGGLATGIVVDSAIQSGNRNSGGGDASATIDDLSNQLADSSSQFRDLKDELTDNKRRMRKLERENKELRKKLHMSTNDEQEENNEK